VTSYHLSLLVAFLGGFGVAFIAMAVLAMRYQRPTIEKRLSAVEQRDLSLLQSIHTAPKERQ
jgi:hypothetical protein